MAGHRQKLDPEKTLKLSFLYIGLEEDLQFGAISQFPGAL